MTIVPPILGLEILDSPIKANRVEPVDPIVAQVATACHGNDLLIGLLLVVDPTKDLSVLLWGYLCPTAVLFLELNKPVEHFGPLDAASLLVGIFLGILCW